MELNDQNDCQADFRYFSNRPILKREERLLVDNRGLTQDESVRSPRSLRPGGYRPRADGDDVLERTLRTQQGQEGAGLIPPEYFRFGPAAHL